MQGRRRCHTGFALLDVLIALIIVGLAVSAVMQFFYTGTIANGEATKLTVAVNLAQQIHEYAMTLPHRNADGQVGRTHGEYPGGAVNPDPLLNKAADDVSDLDNWTFNPVVDSRCQPLLDPVSGLSLFEGWSQYVRVYSMPEEGLTGTPLAAPSATAPKRLVVIVRYRNGPVYSQEWILAPTVDN